MPTSGRPAAITALPQPPSTNQNVPIASASNLRIRMQLQKEEIDRMNRESPGGNPGE